MYACMGASERRQGRRAVGTARAVAPARPPPRPARPGVTLLELLAIVAIIGALAWVAVPRLADSSSWSASGEAVAAQAAGALKLARRLAVEHGADNAAGYRVECSGATWTLRNQTTSAVEASGTLAGGYQVAGGAYTLSFDPYGGVTELNSHASPMTITNGKDAWDVNWVSATGYVWCQKH